MQSLLKCAPTVFNLVLRGLPVFKYANYCHHRRTGNFLSGGAVNHLPKKFLQVAQIFTKQSNTNEGHTMQQHRSY